MKNLMIFAISLMGMAASAQSVTTTATKAATKAATTSATNSATKAASTNSTVKKVNSGATKVEKTADQVAPVTGKNKYVGTTKTTATTVKNATAK